MQDHAVVSKGQWIEARKQLLAEEKEFTRTRDQLSRKRRELPWVRVEEPYVFDTAQGKQTLGELFEGRSQLVVYHFMFDPDWKAGCKSCSFWADNFNAIVTHLNQRDVTLVAISRAPLDKLDAFARRMQWSFKWVSSHGSSFNYDFGVSFSPEQIATGEVDYNFQKGKAYGAEMPGISVFSRDRDGNVFRTYSCYARGLDMLNTAYHYLDLVPNGRDEDDLPGTMSWLRLHDEYGA
jgi:predicted dithiol-disulfide oxidoreductase (DUF899 family)